MDISDLKGHFDTAMTDMKDLVNRQTSEIEKSGESSKQTAALIAKQDKLIADVSQELDSIEKRLGKAEAKSNRPDFNGQPQRAESLGEQYVKSDVFANHAQTKSAMNQSFFQKAITDAPASAGALTDQYRRPDIFKNPDRPSRIRDLVETIPVQDAAVEIMRELVFTNSAAPQAGQLATKAESDITFELVTLAVQTIAHWLPASRQILADAPRLRSFIDGRLMYGLDLESDAQLLYGSGTGQDVTGLFVDAQVSDIGQIAAGTDPAFLPAAMINHVRSAVTQIQLFDYYNATGVVMNPLDWETIETATGSDGHYIWVNVPNGGEQRLWRVPVTISNAVVQDDFILGDWQMGATLYDRESKSIRVSESHAELFTGNGVAVLAEERYAFGVELPKAFAKGKFTVAP